MISQRVVGFIVLIAIAVIFWPIVFVVPETEENVELPVLEMPPRPQIVISERREPDLQKVDPSSLPTIPTAPPSVEQPIDIASPSVTETLLPADFKPSRQTAALERTEFDAQGLPISWELQVATFSTQDRAEQIASELRNKGHKAYVSPVTIAGKRVYQVRIGPKMQVQRLLDVRSEIDAYYGVQSSIVRFGVQ